MRIVFPIVTVPTLLVSCISLSVYVPHPGIQVNTKAPYSVRDDRDGITLHKQGELAGMSLPETIRIEGSYKPYFAWHSPCLFVMENTSLNNIYGDIYEIIAEDLINYPELYFSGKQPITSLTIKINRFNLESTDHCLKNRVSVLFDADTTIELKDRNSASFNYQYNDLISSRVTDLYLISIIGTIPVLIHSGFRGNRQDQLNHLGKSALRGYTGKLQEFLSGGKKETDESSESPAFIINQKPGNSE